MEMYARGSLWRPVIQFKNNTAAGLLGHSSREPRIYSSVRMLPAGLPARSFDQRRLLGCVAPAIFFFLLLATGGFVSVLRPISSPTSESAFPDSAESISSMSSHTRWRIPFRASSSLYYHRDGSMCLSRELDVPRGVSLDPAEVASAQGGGVKISCPPCFAS